MKRYRFFSLLIVCTVIFQLTITAQEDATKSSKDENLKKDSVSLDKEVAQFSKKIGDVIKDNKMMEAKTVKILPYRVDYDIGADFIIMTKHSFIKSEHYGGIIGMKTKSIKIYTGGGGVSKLESIIRVRNFSSNTEEIITIIDPSPASEATDDITFSHMVNGEEIVKGKKLGEIRNTAAFPVANDIKRDFYVPHLTFFYYTIRTIADTYIKGRKDTDSIMTEFLKESIEF